jgi:hypothetical protein
MTVADLLDGIRGEDASRVDGPGVQLDPIGGIHGARRCGASAICR